MRKRNLDNRGSALVVVLAVLSLLALLGATGLSTAVVNVQMRSMNRMSDKNFYKLEAIWDEIYEKLGCTISDILKEDYADVLSGLYTSHTTNEKANAALRRLFLNDETLKTAMEETSDAEAFLKEMYTEDDQDQLTITIGTITSKENGWVLNDLVLTYTEPSTGIETSISMNLELSVPDIRFIDNTRIYSDYILISNGPITFTKGANVTDGIEAAVSGSVRGSTIDIREKSKVMMEGNDIIAGDNSTSPTHTASGKGQILVREAGELTIGGSAMTAVEELYDSNEIDTGDDTGDDTDTTDETDSTEYANNVWAENIVVSGQNSTVFRTQSANLYVKDDLTVSGSGNLVDLAGGNYYGYGNEGTSDPAASSAIILNGTNNTLKLNLDSLTLAGRSYLRVSENLTYPMAESIAQKSTQSIYLVPADRIQIENSETPVTNPWILASGTSSQTVSIKDGDAELTCRLTYTAQDEILGGAAEDKIVFLKKTTNGVTKVYAFYNANYTENAGTEESSQKSPDLKAFFENLLTLDENSTRFQSLLKKGDNVIRIEDAPGVQENGHNIASAGAVYLETTAGEYTLLDTASTSSVRIQQSIDTLKQNYTALRSSLSRTGRTGLNQSQETDLPVALYANAPESVYWFYTDGSYQEMQNSSSVTIGADAKPGVILAGSSGITITGNGSFDGLIISYGPITISGDVTLTADSEVVNDCVTNGEKAKEYFLEVYNPAVTVFSDYSWFVKESDWTRGRR